MSNLKEIDECYRKSLEVCKCKYDVDDLQRFERLLREGLLDDRYRLYNHIKLKWIRYSRRIVSCRVINYHHIRYPLWLMSSICPNKDDKTFSKLPTVVCMQIFDYLLYKYVSHQYYDYTYTVNK